MKACSKLWLDSSIQFNPPAKSERQPGARFFVGTPAKAERPARDRGDTPDGPCLPCQGMCPVVPMPPYQGRCPEGAERFSPHPPAGAWKNPKKAPKMCNPLWHKALRPLNSVQSPCKSVRKCAGGSPAAPDTESTELRVQSSEYRVQSKEFRVQSSDEV